jgi:hypothetical protein
MCPGPLIHNLAIQIPGNLVELALGLQFGELRLVIGVRNGARPQTVAQAEADVVRAHNLANLAEMGVEEVFFVMRQAPLGEDGATARNNPVTRRAVIGTYRSSTPACTVK